METFDVVVIGAGQAGLAVGRELARSDLSYVVLDAENGPGGAWRHAWNSLRLFSPAKWSSLPGALLPGSDHVYPGRDDVIAYLGAYEAKYALNVRRPLRVTSVTRAAETLCVASDAGTFLARAVVSATGTWNAPFVPNVPGHEAFEGRQVHSAFYRSPDAFAGERVVVVGGGNSGAQILADVSTVARTTWATLDPPSFLPDDVDGRVLFDAATRRYHAQQAGVDEKPPSLGDVVMVPSVKAARDRGVLHARPMFERMTRAGVVWPEGREEEVDAVIWCTGFRASLDHLTPLGIVEEGRVHVEGTRSVRERRVWLVGYGSWTGFASATLIGVGRSAKATVTEIVLALQAPQPSA